MLREYQLLIPTVLNDHEPVPSALRMEIEHSLCDRFGGFTRQMGLEGAWRAPNGTIIRDRLDGYLIAATDPSVVIRTAAEIGGVLSQQAVYLRLPDMTAVIVQAQHAGSVPVAALVANHGNGGPTMTRYWGTAHSQATARPERSVSG